MAGRIKDLKYLPPQKHEPLLRNRHLLPSPHPSSFVPHHRRINSDISKDPLTWLRIERQVVQSKTPHLPPPWNHIRYLGI
ncbi:hypothetical protein EYF80_022103 [Liparis tanakae]|uniref:Uncharacterized protein n=1 Tax=Liparis tanakae TaxID=230148 RepID=A0A4Z2HP69_9TELE|nr:hypothetical protein EYF80_022103 [Liparis tanakae]